MTSLSKQTAKSEGRKADLTRHTDEELHSLMDSVTSEMARRASVNAKKRALVRRLEVIAESEGVTLDEVRQYLRGGEQFSEQRASESVAEKESEPAFVRIADTESLSPMAREVSLDRQLESLFQKELAELG